MKSTFQVAIEMTELAKKYEELSECADVEMKKVYTDFVSKLDEYHSKLLQLGLYSRGDITEKEAVTSKAIGGLRSYSRIFVHYEYNNEQLALVEDTGLELHLIPLDCVRYDD